MCGTTNGPSSTPQSVGRSARCDDQIAQRVGHSQQFEYADADNRAPATLLKNAALQGGFVPLRQAGLTKAAAGVTTLEEVYRVTQEADGE